MPDTPSRPWWSTTIWSPGAIPPEDYVWRSLVQVWLPLYDLILILTGVGGLVYGVPAVILLFPGALEVGATAAFTLSAAAALLGIVFPRLSMLERIAKVSLLSLLIAYFGALSLLALFVDPDPRAFIAGIALSATIPPFARLSILRAQARRRAATRAIRAVKASEDPRAV